MAAWEYCRRSVLGDGALGGNDRPRSRPLLLPWPRRPEVRNPKRARTLPLVTPGRRELKSRTEFFVVTYPILEHYMSGSKANRTIVTVHKGEEGMNQAGLLKRYSSRTASYGILLSAAACAFMSSAMVLAASKDQLGEELVEWIASIPGMRPGLAVHLGCEDGAVDLASHHRGYVVCWGQVYSCVLDHGLLRGQRSQLPVRSQMPCPALCLPADSLA